MVTIDIKFGIGRKNLEFSTEYKTLIAEAGNILIEVINSEEFKRNIKTYSWNHRRRGQIDGFNHTKSSRLEVLNKLLSGNDNFTDEFDDDSNLINDGDIDIWIIPYYTKKKIVGKTYPDTYKTWLNLKYWNRRIIQNKINPLLTKIEIGENILHEYTHNLGFGHKGNKKHRNNNVHSVPYALGDIFNKIALKKYNHIKSFDKMSQLDLDNEFEIDCSFCEKENLR